MTVRMGAIEVLGRLGVTCALSPLERLLLDPSSDIREAAGRAIERIRK